ncbi:MAG: GntR family transcriptional regulator [Flavobacteriales bacterium]|nr:GntR family transcriptional regulator [Flavobacteriales bacterium]
MIEVGTYHIMTVLRKTSVGCFLGNNLGDEILLPNKYIPENTEIDDRINVFIYKDSEDRPIATTLIPKAVSGEFAFLTVNDVSPIGSFLDIGLEKDILVPYREQNRRLERGQQVLVYVYTDNASNRMVASCKTNKFTTKEITELSENQEVDILISEKTDLGFKAIVNQKYSGLLYHNEIFSALKLGEKLKGFVKKIREDGKLDISLQKQGYDGIEPMSETILKALNMNNGVLPIGDKSSPEEIYGLLKMSKKNFKKAVGLLYKNKLITIEEQKIKSV